MRVETVRNLSPNIGARHEELHESRACDARCTRRDSGRGAKITFTLNWVAGGDHAPYFYAQKMGWYKQAGLDVDFETGRGSAASAQKVGAGHSQLGLSDMAGVLLFRGKGVDAVGRDERLCQLAAGSLLAQELRHPERQGSRRQEDRQSRRRRRAHDVAGAGEDDRHRSQLGDLGQHRRQLQAQRAQGQDRRCDHLVLQPAPRVRARARRTTWASWRGRTRA